MPKDNENVPLPLTGPITPSEPAGFAAAEMIRCEECLRANPPTRAACLYCGGLLPVTESAARSRRPNLLTPDKTGAAYNIILSGEKQTHNQTDEVANFLNLEAETLARLVGVGQPLPLARTASIDEAVVVAQKLADFGFQTIIVSDQELGLVEGSVIRLRKLVFEDSVFWIHGSGITKPIPLNFAELIQLVQARLLTKVVAIKERQKRTTENEILEAHEFYSDELVVDLYSTNLTKTLRIEANSFDFSCLGDAKALVVNENLSTLVQTFVTRAPQMDVDDSYGKVRQLLDLVWGSEKTTKSAGWRREAGRIAVGATTIDSRQNQFNRYSRLKYHLRKTTIPNARS